MEQKGIFQEENWEQYHSYYYYASSWWSSCSVAVMWHIWYIRLFWFNWGTHCQLVKLLLLVPGLGCSRENRSYAAVHSCREAVLFISTMGRETSQLKDLPLLFIHVWLTGPQHTHEPSNFFQSLACDWFVCFSSDGLLEIGYVKYKYSAECGRNMDEIVKALRNYSNWKQQEQWHEISYLKNRFHIWGQLGDKCEVNF